MTTEPEQRGFFGRRGITRYTCDCGETWVEPGPPVDGTECPWLHDGKITASPEPDIAALLLTALAILGGGTVLAVILIGVAAALLT